MGTSRRRQVIGRLLKQIESLHSEMLRLEKDALPDGVNPAHRDGARNLLHYLALRRHDIRELQQDLASLGFSSLGRTESHVLGTVCAVLHSLTELSGRKRLTHAAEQNTGIADGCRLLERNTEALLGPPPKGRKVRIMVTMPAEAATDYDLVRTLVAEGMNCMRVNCAHDGPAEWSKMIANLRRAEKELGKLCKLEMDLGGPKLRTGPMEPGPAVVKYRPQRDDFGRVTQAARIWLTPAGHPQPAPEQAAASFALPDKFLARMGKGTKIRFTDTRGSRRLMIVRETTPGGCWAEADKTAYVSEGVALTARVSGGKRLAGRVGPLPAKAQTLRLHPGDTLTLTRELHPGQPNPPRIGVSLPEFFDSVKLDQPIWFDDGNIGGVVSAVSPGEVKVNIVQASAAGQKLGAEKGINVPETNLRIKLLAGEDRKNLEFAAQHADILGLSFVRTVADVREVRTALKELGREDLPIMLKIETRSGFENLPDILMEAMHSRAVGVMIARGDLAVECGYQRLAELQEEILWLAEAAHVPVVWATQVLESLAKTGKPLRSEITDAAMGERAECVMLNKGPFVADAVRTLHDILVRMEAHQAKKTSMLRKLHVAAAFPSARRDAA